MDTCNATKCKAYTLVLVSRRNDDFRGWQRAQCFRQPSFAWTRWGGIYSAPDPLCMLGDRGM